MHVVVVGLGQVGLSAVRILEARGHDVVAIDRDTKAIAHAEDHFDVATVQGYGASARVLKAAGCARADLIIAVTERVEAVVIKELTRLTSDRTRDTAEVTTFAFEALIRLTAVSCVFRQTRIARVEPRR